VTSLSNLAYALAENKISLVLARKYAEKAAPRRNQISEWVCQYFFILCLSKTPRSRAALELENLVLRHPNRKIEHRAASSVVGEISLGGWDQQRSIIPACSDISRFSQSTIASGSVLGRANRNTEFW